MTKLLLLLLLLLVVVVVVVIVVITAIEFSLGGSSPYASTDKTSKNKYT
jgi:flagellar basal body-associated protein FliL